MTTVENYVPHESEPYMSERQLAWFKAKLIAEREEILRLSGETLSVLRESPIREPDLAERAAAETDWGRELRTKDRQRKLLSKIAHSLGRIKEGEYGWCEMTGDPIGIPRLLARPVATLTIAAQQLHERQERISKAA